MITYKEGSFKEYSPRLGPLMMAHWDEIGTTGMDRASFNLDVERYLQLEKFDLYLGTGAFDGDKVVGYVSTILDRFIHSKNIWTAVTDAIFVHPDYRNTSVAYKLLKYTEKKLSDRQIDYWIITLDMKAKTAKRLVNKLGFVDSQIHCVKYLKGE